MYTKIASQNPLSIVTLAEAKRQLNIIDSNEDDDHIQLLIDVASELAEGYTKRMLSQGVVNLITTGKQSFFLPYGEATESITPFTVTVNSDPIDFTFQPISQILTIIDWVTYCEDEITVTYNAGYESVPNSVKMGVLMMLSTLFEFRSDSLSGLSIDDVPLTSQKILNKVKIENI